MRQKFSPSKEDPWPTDRSLGAVVLLHQISRCRRLVAADLVEENAEVLRENGGEEAFAAAEEEEFGLEFIGHFSLSLNLSNTLIGGKNSHHRRRIHGHWTYLSAPSSRWIRSLDAVISLQQILPEKTQKCFGRVKEKKPPPPRKRKCLVWRQVREISCSTLFRIFHRFLSCATNVDVVDEKDY
ncbi:uncharacterized protein G2W53_015119 [Senna tora]|uniref:Uncharacterized protein n=1 Tax=Senna tora TaxID=362788 RepID=A0A835C7I1_9FABA|nr:uncharacterized protein G2W53_015119 [Senna tora]